MDAVKTEAAGAGEASLSLGPLYGCKIYIDYGEFFLRLHHIPGYTDDRLMLLYGTSVLRKW